MDSENFAYWLQSFVELNEGVRPTTKQWNIIKEHLATVFRQVTMLPLDKEPDEGAPANPYGLPNWKFPPDYALPPGHVPPEQKFWLGGKPDILC